MRLTEAQLQKIAVCWKAHGYRHYSGTAWDGIDAETQFNFIRGFLGCGQPFTEITVYHQGFTFFAQLTSRQDAAGSDP